jgi:hypothetical protein
MKGNPQLPNNAIAACRSEPTRRQQTRMIRIALNHEATVLQVEKREQSAVEGGRYCEILTTTEPGKFNSSRPSLHSASRATRPPIGIGHELAVSSRSILAAALDPGSAPRSVAQPEPNEP